MRATYRRLALVAPLALLGLAFFFNSVHGQRHHPRPPAHPPVHPPSMPKPPAFNPTPNPVIRPPMPNPRLGGTVIEKVWTCSGCGKVIGRNTPFPPGTCPYCQARIVNGIGPPNTTNLPGSGMPGMNPNPSAGMPPFNPNPGMPGVNPNPGMQPPPPNPGTPPPANPGVNNNVTGVGPDRGAPAAVTPVSWSGSDSSSSSSSSGKSRFDGKVIALVVGIVVIGILALVGGTFLMIYTMKSGSASYEPRRRRRPRRYDDYDD